MSDPSVTARPVTEVEASLNARLRPLKVSEYLALARLGAFEGEKVELLRGRVVRMAPQGEEHAWTSGALTNLLVKYFGDLAQVRPAAPMHAAEDSMPEPDFMLVPHTPGPGPHPASALLLVEIAASSLRDDRAVKAPLYAESGSPEYWIVDVAGGRLEVFRRPREGRWEEHRVLGPGDTIRPVAFPQVEFPLSGFLLDGAH